MHVMMDRERLSDDHNAKLASQRGIVNHSLTLGIGWRYRLFIRQRPHHASRGVTDAVRAQDFNAGIGACPFMIVP
jgi:hypothetical protein